MIKFFSFKLSTVSFRLSARGMNWMPKFFAFSTDTWYTGVNGLSSAHLQLKILYWLAWNQESIHGVYSWNIIMNLPVELFVQDNCRLKVYNFQNVSFCPKFIKTTHNGLINNWAIIDAFLCKKKRLTTFIQFLKHPWKYCMPSLTIVNNQISCEPTVVTLLGLPIMYDWFFL